jgi:hypothetical protein
MVAEPKKVAVSIVSVVALALIVGTLVIFMFETASNSTHNPTDSKSGSSKANTMCTSAPKLQLPVSTVAPSVLHKVAQYVAKNQLRVTILTFLGILGAVPVFLAAIYLPKLLAKEESVVSVKSDHQEPELPETVASSEPASSLGGLAIGGIVAGSVAFIALLVVAGVFGLSRIRTWRQGEAPSAEAVENIITLYNEFAAKARVPENCSLNEGFEINHGSDVVALIINYPTAAYNVAAARAYDPKASAANVYDPDAPAAKVNPPRLIMFFRGSKIYGPEDLVTSNMSYRCCVLDEKSILELAKNEPSVYTALLEHVQILSTLDLSTITDIGVERKKPPVEQSVAATD